MAKCSLHTVQVFDTGSSENVNTKDNHMQLGNYIYIRPLQAIIYNSHTIYIFSFYLFYVLYSDPFIQIIFGTPKP